MKENVVVFAGAGFSKGFGIPLTGELWRLGQTKNPGVDETGLLWELITNCRPFLDSVARNDEDVETLLTEWEAFIEANETRDPLMNANDSGRTALDHYITNLSMHLEDATKNIRTKDAALAVARWIGRTSRTHSLSFITTNYDRGIEIMASMAKIRCTYVTRKSGMLPIRKPHGSLNWIRFDADSRREDGWSPERIGVVDGTNIYDCKLEEIPWIAGQIPPVLIPPTRNKRYRDIFVRQFADSHELLASADRLMFVGYSFPPADGELEKFLGKAISDSRCRSFMFINPDTKSKSRAEKLLKGRKVEWFVEPWSAGHFDRFVS